MIINDEIVQNLGPVAAVIHGVLSARDTSGGVVMTHQEIADAAGIPYRTARRYLDKLLDQGYVKIETQIEYIVGQRPNRYQIPTRSAPDPLSNLDTPCPYWTTPGESTSLLALLGEGEVHDQTKLGFRLR